MNIALFAVIFAVIMGVLLGALSIGYFILRSAWKRSIEQRLGATPETEAPIARTVSILNEDRRTALPVRLQAWAMSQVDAAGLKWSRSKVLAVCLACALVGGVFGLRIGQMLPRAAAPFIFVPVVLSACLPFLYLGPLTPQAPQQN